MITRLAPAVQVEFVSKQWNFSINANSKLAEGTTAGVNDLETKLSYMLESLAKILLDCRP